MIMSSSSAGSTFWKQHLDKIGVGGSAFAALCCLGFPALLAILSAIGLGFLIHDAVLIPMLVVFLLMTLVGLYYGMKSHRQPWALAAGIVGTVLLFGSIFFGNGVLAGLGIAALVGASIANVWLRARQLQKA